MVEITMYSTRSCNLSQCSIVKSTFSTSVLLIGRSRLRHSLYLHLTILQHHTLHVKNMNKSKSHSVRLFVGEAIAKREKRNVVTCLA